jgi:hypothetical protein
MAREARREGWRVVAFALGEPGGLADAADRVVRCRLGDVGPILEILAAEQIHHVVLAGRVSKEGLFHGAALDAAARAIVEESLDWTDDALLSSASAALASMGIDVLDQRRFLGPWLAPAGLAAGPAPDARVEADLARGAAVARALAAHGIGQTVVLREGSVAAVEAMEGTDETILRGGRIAGPGSVVVKLAKPRQDMRFDVPVVGLGTLEALREARSRVLALEAGKTLLIDRADLLRGADEAEIAVVGVEG